MKGAANWITRLITGIGIVVVAALVIFGQLGSGKATITVCELNTTSETITTDKGQVYKTTNHALFTSLHDHRQYKINYSKQLFNIGFNQSTPTIVFQKGETVAVC